MFDVPYPELSLRNSMNSVQRRPEQPLVKQVIQRQLNKSGNILMSAIEPLPEVEFFDGQLNNISIAWTVGHLACVMDLFGGWLSNQGRTFGSEIHQVFNPLELGGKQQEKWELVDPKEFSKADILLLLRQAQVRLLDILDHFDLGLWNVMPPAYVPDTLPTYGSIWEALAVHTFWHLGELCGSSQRFHGTYTINSVLHYFYVPRQPVIESKPVIDGSPEQPLRFLAPGRHEANGKGNHEEQEITVFLTL